MENQKYYEKEILHIAVTGCAVAVNKDTYVPMTCSKDMCEHCINHKENGRCDKEKTAILTWMKEEYIDPAERIDWAKIAIDTPILVRDKEDELWQRGHFAGLSNEDGVFVFPDGKTSFTADKREDVHVAYKHARLAEVSFNKDLFYQMYKQLLTLGCECDYDANTGTCLTVCPYCNGGECMYYRFKGFTEENEDAVNLGDMEMSDIEITT